MSRLILAFAQRYPRRIIEGEHGPYLSRYTLAELPDGGHVYLHFFHRGDADRELHNHPWAGTSIILTGGYREERRGEGGRFQCNHCGATHDPFKGQAVELWSLDAVGKAFTKQHAECPEPEHELCVFCFSPQHAWDEHVSATTKTPGDWIDCGDTGISSKAIWRHMMGLPPAEWGHPHDPDDFGRCYRLLAAPWALGWRARIGEMARYGSSWAALSAHWSELESLFLAERRSGSAPKLYKRMSDLINGRAATPKPPPRRRQRRKTWQAKRAATK